MYNISRFDANDRQTTETLLHAADETTSVTGVLHHRKTQGIWIAN